MSAAENPSTDNAANKGNGADSIATGASQHDADSGAGVLQPARGETPTSETTIGSGVDGGADAVDTPFVLAKQAMLPFLNRYRDGHAQWDAASVLAQADVVAEQFKVRKPLLRKWTEGQLELLKTLRAQTTRPVPETGQQINQVDGGPSDSGSDDNATAAFDRATDEMRPYIEKFERGDISREAVLSCVPTVAARHGVPSRELRSWARGEMDRLVRPLPSGMGGEVLDPAAVPEDPDELARQQAAAWALCHDIAPDPDLIARLLAVAHRIGVVGDRRGVVGVYLAMTSRLLDDPASLLRKGASSSGKSFPIDSLAALFTKDIDYIELTAASAKALPYDQRSYRHRVVLLGEATALAPGKNGDEAFVGMVREMLSKGRIVYTTVIKTGGKNAQLVSVAIEKAGPIALITTAAREIVEEEMNTRMLASLADETPQQSRTVVNAMGARLKGTAPQSPDEAELKQWRAFQDWLRLGPRDVVVPYADALSDLVDVRSLRIRRDFPAVGSLIEASALVHRAQRRIDAQGRIVADLKDYAFVLSALGEGLDEVRFGNIDQLNQVRQVVDETLQKRRHEWWRDKTFAGTMNSLIQHCHQHHLQTLAERIRSAAAKLSGNDRGSFAKLRDVLSNGGTDPTYGGLGPTKAAAEKRMLGARLGAGRTAWAELTNPSGPAPREVEMSYGKLAELLGVTYKVARTRLNLAIEGGAVIEHAILGQSKTAPHRLSPGKVVVATKSAARRGAFPSLAEVQEKCA